LKRKLNAGINLNEICTKELSDEALYKVSGGSAKADAPFVCRCGNADISKMSYQLIDYLLSRLDYACNYDYAYRCEECNTYILRLNNGGIAYE
jgi:hypothetical protein